MIFCNGTSRYIALVDEFSLIQLMPMGPRLVIEMK